MKYEDEYEAKRIGPDDAANLVSSGDTVEYGPILSAPFLIDDYLAERVHGLESVQIRSSLLLKEPAVLQADQSREHFAVDSWFLSHTTRPYADEGVVKHIPYTLSDAPKIFRKFLKGRDRPNIALIATTPMSQETGHFNFGASAMYTKAVAEVADTVVVEVNETMPWIPGGFDHVVHLSEVDDIVKNEKYPVPTVPPRKPTREDEAIAHHIVKQIEDGSCIQLGIGGLPNVIGELLLESDLQDLGIHSEMVGDSMVRLIEEGLVTGREKHIDQGQAALTFTLGTRDLYAYVDHNPLLASYPTDYVNDPYTIAKNDNQIAINCAIQIDLTGQVCSESFGCRQISGTGGQLDFTMGAYLSKGGKAFTCLHSTQEGRDGKLKSNIVPTLELGAVVTVPRTWVNYVVTEYGCVNLKGKSTAERAKDLISIADPDMRDRLKGEAKRLNLLR